MIIDIVIRYLHFVGILVIFAAVLGQHLLLGRAVPRSVVVKAQQFDIAYAIAVIVVLATGLLQWFSGSKPAVFYASNPVFHAKLTCFLLVGVVSAYPSVFLGRNRKGDPEETVAVPKGVVHCVRLELVLLVLMPLLAVIMSKGLGIPVDHP